MCALDISVICLIFLPFSILSMQSKAVQNHPTVPTNTLQSLQRLIHSILNRLPEDLQSCLATTFGT